MYNRDQFAGQWGGGDGRDQPDSGRPHEPDRVLLTEGEQAQQQAHLPPVELPQNLRNGGKNDLYQSQTDSSTINDTALVKNLADNNKNTKKTYNNIDAYENNPSNNKTKSHQKSFDVENGSFLPGSTSYVRPDVNTVGIPVSNNLMPHHYFYSQQPVSATNHYVVGPFEHPLSPSNYPTMIVGQPAHHSHAIILQNNSKSKLNQRARPQRMNQPLFLTPGNMKPRTKHLKPPSNSKLKTKLVKANVSLGVQSTSQSCMFYPAAEYDLPGTSQPHIKQNVGNVQSGQQDQPNVERYTIPPSAPVMCEEEPAPLCSSGLPPAYATIDPKKLRTRHVRPAVFKRKGFVVNRQYQLL